MAKQYKLVSEDMFNPDCSIKVVRKVSKEVIEKPKVEPKFSLKAKIVEKVVVKPSIINIASVYTPIRTEERTIKENSLQNLTGESSGYLNANSARPLKKRTTILSMAMEHSVGFKQDIVPMKMGKEVTEAEKAYYVNKTPDKPFLTFITLTLPAAQIHRDVVLTEIFTEKFIKTMREQWGVEQYIWRKEAQERGAIHFHVLADRYIDWKKIRKRWNDIMEEHNYIKFYRIRQQKHNEYNEKIECGMDARRKLAKQLIRWVKDTKKSGKLSTVTIEEAKTYVRKAVGKQEYTYDQAMKDAEAMQLACFKFQTKWQETDKNMASFKANIKNTLAKGWVNPKLDAELKQFLFSLQKAGKTMKQYKDVLRNNAEKLKELDYNIQFRRFREGVATNFSDPNSTDIHKIENLKSVSAYMSKYMGKEAEVDTSWINFENQCIEKRSMKVPQRIKNIHTNEIDTIEVEKDVDCLCTFETQTNEFGITEKVYTKVEKYEPVYKVRGVSGKIWGCSTGLRKEFIEYPTFIKAEKSFYMEENFTEEPKFKIEDDVKNLDVVETIEKLTAYIGAEYIDEFTKSVCQKTNIKEAYNTFIPLWKNIQKGEKTEKMSFKAFELLQELSPPIAEQYDKHYKNVFISLYPHAEKYVKWNQEPLEIGKLQNQGVFSQSNTTLT